MIINKKVLASLVGLTTIGVQMYAYAMCSANDPCCYNPSSCGPTPPPQYQAQNPGTPPTVAYGPSGITVSTGGSGSPSCTPLGANGCETCDGGAINIVYNGTQIASSAQATMQLLCGPNYLSICSNYTWGSPNPSCCYQAALKACAD